MKFIKGFTEKAKQLRQHFDYLNMQQKIQVFDLAWEGNQIPNIPGITKLKGQLPGVRYKKIFETINKALNDTIIDKEKNYLEKELIDFYSHPITEKHKQYYGDYKEQVKLNLNPLNKEWLKQLIVPDLKICEELQKKRIAKRYGINI